jgi:hypothetical protein
MTRTDARACRPIIPDPSRPHPTHSDRSLQLQDAEASHLLAYLACVPDPRGARGRRHPLVAILAMATAAVLAGARSIAAIAEWTADAPQPVRAALGARHHAPGDFTVPAEASIRRTLAHLDADALAAAVGAWLADREPSGPRPAGGGPSPSTARPCAAPAGQVATAARCTCWQR